MHKASYEFLMKPKESARCHQTLSARVDETMVIMTCVEGTQRVCMGGGRLKLFQNQW